MSNFLSHISENVPDTIKVGASVAAPSLSVLGLPVEQWGYVLSAVVAIMVIIEKTPVVVQRLKALYAKIKQMAFRRR